MMHNKLRELLANMSQEEFNRQWAEIEAMGMQGPIIEKVTKHLDTTTKKMTYKIPIIWQSMKTYSIEAGNLQEAVEKALGLFLYEPDQHYIEDSWQIDDVVYDLDEPLDLDSVISKI